MLLKYKIRFYIVAVVLIALFLCFFIISLVAVVENFGGSSHGTGELAGEVIIPIEPQESAYQSPFPNLFIKVTSEIGNREGEYHAGMDLVAYDGAPISAIAGGEIVSSYFSKTYGNVITINQKNGVFSCYAHMQDRYVKEGDKVVQGQVLGLQGNTGKSNGSHLHFEMRTANVNGSANVLNPRDYLKF